MGGTAAFTAGAFRCVTTASTTSRRSCGPDKDEIDRSDFGTYTQDQFYDDISASRNTRPTANCATAWICRSREAMRCCTQA